MNHEYTYEYPRVFEQHVTPLVWNKTILHTESNRSNESTLSSSTNFNVSIDNSLTLER